MISINLVRIILQDTAMLHTDLNLGNISDILAFGVNAYASSKNFPGVIALSGMFCVTSLALVYNIEKCFSESSMGHVGALCIFVLLGAFFLIIRMSMDLLWYIPFLKEIMKYLTWIFALLPSYSLASGLMDIGNLVN